MRSTMIKLACCGDNCNVCPRYTTTISKNKNNLLEIEKIWKMAGWRKNISNPDEMKCYGCSSAEVCFYGIRECCFENHVENCGQCKKYPCIKIIKVFEKTMLYAEKCKKIFSNDIFEILNKAFFLKKENLDSKKN
jgi:hypothetical protein